MLERLKNLKSSAAGLAAGIIAVAALAGIDIKEYGSMIITALGIIGTLIGLFSKD